ncbi:kinesin-like protein KIF11-like protein [Halteromyces radiatus]|uniref:kinesin-like protein KIF11-like protein n=1 Tax=Halteromyces radiatus TaxID=101107 RepID=UPI00221E8288|nr:kinesin-like protein KIF11-like protein [Halteromyces radiatus]KAI8098726.1 kinesin-like protein KIF11-like protein [Halteromyces radiatus]
MWTKNRTSQPQKQKSSQSSTATTKASSLFGVSARRQPFNRSSTSNGGISTRRSDLQHLSNDKGTNIQVVLRCRGRNETELAAESPIILEPSGHKDVLLTTSNKRFSFDRVFDQHATQEHIYNEVVQPILDQVLEGFNCTIFAYGQTGSGKTYTMEGELEQRTVDAGIIPRVIDNLFETLESKGTEYSVKVSLLELYNEELRDLLNPTNHQQGRQIKIFEDKISSGVIVQGIDEKYVQNAEEGLNILRSGIKYRSIGATKCNDKSSRSHCIFSINIHIRESIPGKEDVFRIGKLNLVDLAGSENINRSGAELVRAREAGMINQSLLTLGRVINHLVEHSTHIPYRESKLTRLLKDSLGGKTRTCIIATVSIAKMNQEEIISTLDYANRAKNIRNRPEANQPSNRNIHLHDLELKIEQLKADLQASYEKNGVYMTQKSYDALKDENQQLKDAVKDKQDRLDKAKQELLQTESKMRDVTAKIDSIIRDCDRKVEHIKMEEKEMRTQQTDQLLDYFGLFELDLRSLHKEIQTISKRYTQLYQRHIQDDQHHLESCESDINKWKSIVQESMEQQIHRLKEQNKKQRELFQKEKEQEEKTWEKVQQMIIELGKSRQDSLETTLSSLNHSMMDNISLTESSTFKIESETKKQMSHFKIKKDEIGTMTTELHDDQDRYKKV